MRISDVMTKDPVTADPDTRVHHALKIMREHKIRKLPIVKEGKLVGMVTHDMLMEVTPSKATGLSIQEIHYLLTEMKVRDIMDKDPTIVSPDTPFEEALALSMKKGITAFPVMENGTLVGISTNGDIIRLLTKLLGLQEEGVRITIEGLGAHLGELREIISVFDRHSAPVLSMLTLPRREKKDWLAVIRLRARDATAIVKDLKGAGFQITYVSKFS